MPTYFRLQDLLSVSESDEQRVDEAVDISNLRTLIIQIRRVVAASGGCGLSASLKLQHAAVLEVDSFVDVTGVSVSLTSTGTTVHVAHDLMRYLRWVSDFCGTPSTAAQFLIDVTGRET